MTTPPVAAIVKRLDAEDRYQILVDGEPVGLTAYRDRDGQRVFFHTEVDSAFAGRGLAGQLVGHALADTRASGRRIVAVCPYVATFLKRHHEYADVTDPQTADVLRWLEEELAEGPST